MMAVFLPGSEPPSVEDDGSVPARLRTALCGG